MTFLFSLKQPKKPSKEKTIPLFISAKTAFYFTKEPSKTPSFSLMSLVHHGFE